MAASSGEGRRCAHLRRQRLEEAAAHRLQPAVQPALCKVGRGALGDRRQIEEDAAKLRVVLRYGDEDVADAAAEVAHDGV